MKILLVQPPLDPMTSIISKLGLAEPLGIEYLAAAVPDHEVRILDLRVAGDVKTAIEDFDPHIIGVSSLTPTIGDALRLLRLAKVVSPNVFTIIGGFHATLVPEDCFRDFVDVIVQGDGEDALREIIAALEYRRSLVTVSGILFQQNGEFVRTSPRQLPNINTYNVPARHLTETFRKAYRRVGLGSILSVLTSRGCSRRCSFCSIWRFHHGKYRTRCLESIIEEVAARPETVIDFPDDDSFGDLRRMEAFARLFKEHLPNRICRLFVRADSVVKSPRLFEKWAEAGMQYALMGLEAFVEKELKDVNKSASLSENREALHILKSLGIRVVGYIIARPEYTRDDFKRLADTVTQLKIAQPFFTTLTPFPGTTLYEQWEKHLLTKDWKYYNCFHSVVETALPRREYYTELANLYRRVYEGNECSLSSSEISWYEEVARAIEALGEPENDVQILRNSA